MYINLNELSIDDLKKLKKDVDNSIETKISESIETIDFREYIENLKKTIQENKKKIEENDNLYHLLDCTKISNLKFLKNQIDFPHGKINLCSGLKLSYLIGGSIISTKDDNLLTLARFFNKINNVANYQGTYTLYQYLFDYLAKTIKEKTKNPSKKINKDYVDKKILVMEDFKNIAQALYDFRLEKPGSRVAVCDNSLWRHKDKVEGAPFTIPQMDLIDTIAFCTPLKELEKKDYTRLKRLVFYPIEKLK